MRVGDKLDHALKSMEGMYDELIIIDDVNVNLAYKINKGLKKAKGDYLVVSNDDVLLVKGSLHDLCIPDTVTSPHLITGMHKRFHAHMWCYSRKTYKKIVGTVPGWADYGKPGYFEGYYKLYYDDSDYWMKIKSNNINISLSDSCGIRHDHPGWTAGTLGDNSSAEDINSKIFVARWGAQAIGEIQ